MYLVFTNFLIFIFGCALLSFGMMAIHLKISVAMLIPINVLKSMTFTLHFIFIHIVCSDKHIRHHSHLYVAHWSIGKFLSGKKITSYLMHNNSHHSISVSGLNCYHGL